MNHMLRRSNRVRLVAASLAIAGLSLWMVVGAAGAAEPAAPALPPEKHAILDYYAQLQSDGLRNVAPVPGHLTTSDTPLPVAPTSGQVRSSADTVAPPGIRDAFTNSWFIVGPPVTAAVWAGAAADDPGQGILVVAVWSDPQGTILQSQRIVQVPGRHGVASISSASALKLSGSSADGTTFTLDVATGSVDEPAP